MSEAPNRIPLRRFFTAGELVGDESVSKVRKYAHRSEHLFLSPTSCCHFPSLLSSWNLTLHLVARSIESAEKHEVSKNWEKACNHYKQAHETLVAKVSDASGSSRLQKPQFFRPPKRYRFSPLRRLFALNAKFGSNFRRSVNLIEPSVRIHVPPFLGEPANRRLETRDPILKKIARSGLRVVW